MDRRGGRDEMAAAAHADVLLDDAKLRDARWHRATAGDVLLREATNMRPTGTNRDGRTMVLARELWWWWCGGWGAVLASGGGPVRGEWWSGTRARTPYGLTCRCPRGAESIALGRYYFSILLGCDFF